MDRLDEIRERLAKAQHGPWKVADYKDKAQVGRNWELADFGECAHHNKKVWITTDNLHASQSNGACPCEDAAFVAAAREDVSYLLSQLDAARKVVEAARKALRSLNAYNAVSKTTIAGAGIDAFELQKALAALNAAGKGE